MKDIKVLGIDLAKNVFQLHGADANGKKVITKRLNREKPIRHCTRSWTSVGGFNKVIGSADTNPSHSHSADRNGQLAVNSGAEHSSSEIRAASFQRSCGHQCG